MAEELARDQDLPILHLEHLRSPNASPDSHEVRIACVACFSRLQAVSAATWTTPQLLRRDVTAEPGAPTPGHMAGSPTGQPSLSR
eukprot:CAMPEP_0170588256 /NCGR_PEP_ID=MMETSP0224-20130122/10733_1 /TAXON_ID=285029 /ORGANISM="Togula jolla, Strain CCCM 725" /LENGTH=84 /DNA_ID=CAMNT_0010911961 /DNA_START=871 /DNA_END=1123 /DNA_ORIENTATION=+